MKSTTIMFGAILVTLSAVSANAAWTERRDNCRRSCDWKGAIISCKGPLGVPFPCHQWQKRCGEWICSRTSH